MAGVGRESKSKESATLWPVTKGKKRHICQEVAVAFRGASSSDQLMRVLELAQLCLAAKDRDLAD
eukprot:1159234-Pelagomonas_calceolata.AAC.5